MSNPLFYFKAVPSEDRAGGSYRGQRILDLTGANVSHAS